MGYDKKGKVNVIATAAPPLSLAFGVNLESDGGSDGNKTTEVSWTYKATMPGVLPNYPPQVIGTGMTPVVRIVKKVTTAKATTGVVFFVQGSPVLFFTDEKPAESPCGS